MKKISIYTTLETGGGEPFSFIGKHLPERERPNWHYYEREDGAIYHFRKEHMVLVIEEDWGE